MDSYSYQCGVIDCFNEMVRAGLKPLALSHPCSTRKERDAFFPFCEEICLRYGTLFFPEDEPLLTDLFPLSMNRGKYNILFYRQKEVLDSYMALKERKSELLKTGGYSGEARKELAVSYGKLLGYPKEGCIRLIKDNSEKE